jgi:hypothetical protein
MNITSSKSPSLASRNKASILLSPPPKVNSFFQNVMASGKAGDLNYEPLEAVYLGTT